MADRNSLTQSLPLRVELPVSYRICTEISKARTIRENEG